MLSLLSTARSSVFPSLYEGLGLPILESYAAGTPCFASNITSTKEFVDKDCSFSPTDCDDLTNTIVKIYNDESICRKSLNFGYKLIKEMTWQKIAENVINLCLKC